MGILHKALQLSIAATMKMMMVTVLMLACLATNILSRTYLVETKDHGYGRRRMMMPQDGNLVDEPEYGVRRQKLGFSDFFRGEGRTTTRAPVTVRTTSARQGPGSEFLGRRRRSIGLE